MEIIEITTEYNSTFLKDRVPFHDGTSYVPQTA